MTGFLERVVKEKAVEIAAKKEASPVAELERRAAKEPLRDFRQAISLRGGIIAEIKKRSPSVTAFRQCGAPPELAAVYETNGARAISIVTDESHFGTSLSDLAGVRRASSLPVLVKDFVIDPYQVVEARAAGADAILLIARILPLRAFVSLLRYAHELGMSALVECHDEEDVAKATAAGAGIIGINNRDLKTLEVSTATTRRLLSVIPDGAIRVSESGIATHGEIEELVGLGVDAFLIGGALLDSVDPGLKLRELIGNGAARRGA